MNKSTAKKFHIAAKFIGFSRAVRFAEKQEQCSKMYCFIKEEVTRSGQSALAAAARHGSGIKRNIKGVFTQWYLSMWPGRPEASWPDMRRRKRTKRHSGSFYLGTCDTLATQVDILAYRLYSGFVASWRIYVSMCLLHFFTLAWHPKYLVLQIWDASTCGSVAEPIINHFPHNIGP